MTKTVEFKYDIGIVEIIPLFPHGTNSTLFTKCCETAISDDEGACPTCQRLVIGYDAKTSNERHMIRWRNATKFWERQ